MNSSSGLLHNDPFDIVEETRSTVTSFGILTNQLIIVLESTSSQSTPTKIVETPHQLFEAEPNSLITCLHWWVAKAINLVGPNVGDINIARHVLIVRNNMVVLF